jgi:hypothetical protein
MVTDSLQTNAEDGSVFYLNRRIVYDTLLAIDTLVLVDTLVVTKSGTDTISTSPDAGYELIEDSRAEHPVFGNSSDSSRLVLINSSSGDIVSRTGCYTMPEGTIVSIEYIDADGDNLLFSANPGTVPAAQFNGSRKSANTEAFLTMLFDAGLDMRLSPSADNKVTSFNRYLVEYNDTIETTRFSIEADSSIMTIDKFDCSDSIYSCKTRYSSLSDGHLSGIIRTLLFRKGEMDRIVILCSPDMSIDDSTRLSGMEFKSLLVSLESDTSTLEGTADLVTGIIAVYRSNSGKTYDVTVSTNGIISIKEK